METTSDDEPFGELDEGRLSNDTFHEVGVSSNSRDSDMVVGRELSVGNQECESSRFESEWLEQDQPMGVWVKWRGKWQAGIWCARSDWPLSEQMKGTYLVILPHKGPL
ncbi:hypothetical protein Tco_1153177 [Tanacetum coccineum]